MVNARLRSFRRNELIEATIAAISKGGLQDTTLATIGRQAGMAPDGGEGRILQPALGDGGDGGLDQLVAAEAAKPRIHHG